MSFTFHCLVISFYKLATEIMPRRTRKMLFRIGDGGQICWKSDQLNNVNTSKSGKWKQKCAMLIMVVNKVLTDRGGSSDLGQSDKCFAHLAKRLDCYLTHAYTQVRLHGYLTHARTHARTHTHRGEAWCYLTHTQVKLHRYLTLTHARMHARMHTHTPTHTPTHTHRGEAWWLPDMKTTLSYCAITKQ